MTHPGRVWMVFLGSVALVALATATPDATEPGVSPSEIVVGQCAALSGAAAGQGTGIRAGLLAALEEGNTKGGVWGRKLRLISADDAYDPEKCVDCTTRLIEDGAFALTGFVGTPTAKVAAPIAQDMKVPLVGLFTGAMLLRQPAQRYVVNIRASYDDETDALVGYLAAKTGARRFAVFHEDDSFGLAGLSSAEKALAKRNLSLAAKGSYERNTLAVRSGLSKVMEGAPDAVLIVAPYQPAAEFVRLARALGLHSALAAISYVGTEGLIGELGPAAEGMTISQVVPSPADPSLPLVRDFRAALQRSAPAEPPSYVSLEGYLSGRVLLAALGRAGADPTREKLLDAIEGMAGLDVGGMAVSFSANNHQGSQAVYLTQVEQGKAVPAR